MSWKKAKLGEVCEVIAGQSPPSSSYNSKGIGLPFFQGKADFGENFPKVRLWCNAPNKIAKPNDVLLSVRAPVGPTNVCDVESCIGRGLAAIRSNGKTDYKYVYYYFKHIEHKLANAGNGSTFSAITVGDVKTLEIPLPSLPTQQKIAAILDAADNLRRKDKELLAKYDSLLQSIFYHFFGDPVRNERGWDTKSITNLVENAKHSIKRGPFGGALKKEIFVPDGYLVYEQYHALNNDFSFGRYFISEKKFRELVAFKVVPGDILISCSGVYLGKLAIVPEGSKPGIINQALLKVRLNENVMTNHFFTFLFTHSSFRKKFFGDNRGSGIPNFPPMEEFKAFDFICPPIEEQRKFTTIAQNVIQQKAQIKEQIQQSEALFQTLLQKAFKGELVP